MGRSTYDNVRVELADEIAWIEVNRPDKLNALNRKTMEEIDGAVGAAVADDSIRVLVITGSGDKAFVAGADIGEMAGYDALAGQRFSRFLMEVLDHIERSPKPVIAAINGFALGGGCELAMACHVRIAGRSAQFGQPEVLLGLIPGAGGTQRLQRLVGRGHALDLVLSGERISAEEAHRIGLVTSVVEDAVLRDEVKSYARRLCQRSPVALARALEAVISGGEMAQPEAMRLESSLFGLCFATEDMREGTRAFLEKRKPDFPGR